MMTIKVCRCGMNMNYPQNWSWLLMIATIVLWFHSPDAAVTLKVAFMSVAILHTPGGCDILYSGSARSP